MLSAITVHTAVNEASELRLWPERWVKPEVTIGCQRWVAEFPFRGLVHQTPNLYHILCPDFPCASRKRALPLTQISRRLPGGKPNPDAAGPQAAARVFAVSVAPALGYNCAATGRMNAMTAIAITATSAAVDYHRKQSRRSLAQVDAALERGETEHASQAIWEAAAHGVRAAAALRGWPYATHWDLGQVIIRLMQHEGGSIDLNTNFIMAHAFDRIDRAWEIPIEDDDIRYAKGPVTELLKMLEAMDS